MSKYLHLYEKDQNKGEIYLLTCKTSGKHYVGQANNYVKDKQSAGGIKLWGSNGRWKSHVKESLNIHQDHCRILNYSIRKYGKEDFKIETLGEYPIGELDEMEVMFIKQYNSIQPNGYNLTHGGRKGKVSEETRIKMSESKKGRKQSEEEKKNNTRRQIGNRRDKIKRKHEEDRDLPKYVCAVRNHGEITDYVVKCFPIGIEDKKYLKNRIFNVTSYGGVENAKKMAIKELENIKKKYAYIEEEIKKKNEAIVKEKLAKIQNIKVEKVIDELPEYIFPVYKQYLKIGYYVEGFKNHQGKAYPKKEFVDCKAPWRNLENAKRYIEALKIKNQDANHKIGKEYRDKKANVRVNSDDDNLPKFLYKYRNNKLDKDVGYCIGGIDVKQKDGTSKKFTKKFCDSKKTMDQKLKDAVEFLEKFKKENEILNL